MAHLPGMFPRGKSFKSGVPEKQFGGTFWRIPIIIKYIKDNIFL